MRDDLDPRDETLARTDATAPERATRPDQKQEKPLTDREVPLDAAHMPEVIQKWLDGESVSEAELRASGRDYELWRKVEAETSRRRRITTPAPLADEIMKAIPPHKKK